MYKVNICKNCIRTCKIAGQNCCNDYQRIKRVNWFVVIAVLIYTSLLFYAGFEYGLYQHRADYKYWNSCDPEWKQYQSLSKGG